MGLRGRRERFRLLILVGALAGLIIAVLLATVLSRRNGPIASAHFPPATGTDTGTPHPGLDFSMGVDTDNNTATGDQRDDGHGQPRGDNCVSYSKLLITATPAAPSTCHLPPGTEFTMHVYLNSLGGVPNYDGFDIYLSYSGVTLASFSKDASSNWPSCGLPVVSGTPTGTPPPTPYVLAGCASGDLSGTPTPPSTYVGRIASATFNCAADGSVTMTHGIGKTDLDQPVPTATPEGSPIETHGEVEGSSEALTIICDAPTLTPTPTPTATPYPEISLNAESLPAGILITCDPPTPPSTKPQRCTVPVQPTPTVGAFQIVLDANHIPGGGYGGFTSEVVFGGLDLLSRSCLEEVTWPQRFLCSQVVPTPVSPPVFGSKQHQSRSAIFPPFPTSTYTGDLVHINVDCPREGQFRVVLPAYSAATPNRPQAAAYYDSQNTPVPVATVNIEPLDLNGDGVADTASSSFPIASALIINCVAVPTAAPTETPTVTPTPQTTAVASPTPCEGTCPTPSDTSTPTITNTPGPTNTPAPTSTATPGPACLDSATATLSVPGKVTTDTEGDGATGTDQVETSVTTTEAGQVTICERLPVLPNPPGYSQFGQQVDISAPQATTARPLMLIFKLDTSIVPPGATADQVQLFKDGSIVPPCSGTPNTASPNPCVQNRTMLTGSQAGDVQMTVLSSVASSWTFAVSSGTPGDANCDGHANSIDAALVLQYAAGLVSSLACGQNADVNGDGTINSLDALLILQYDAGLIPSLPAGHAGGTSVWWGFAPLARWLKR